MADIDNGALPPKNQVSRRHLLGATPAILAGLAVPAVAESETPIIAKFREWERFWNYLNTDEAVASLTDEEFDDACQRRRDMECEIVAMPARDARDFLAKVLAETANGDHELPPFDRAPEFWAEARSFLPGNNTGWRHDLEGV